MSVIQQFWKIYSSGCDLATHKDLMSLYGSHPQKTSPAPFASVSVSEENCAFYVMEACCSL